MASWQAYISSAILRRLIKPRFARAKNITQLRNLMKSAPFKVPVDVRITSGTLGGVPGEWVEGQTSKATLLYFHGGGYIAMSPKTHRPITAAFARRGFVVFVPSYRLAPEHRFPAAIEDTVNCYRALLSSGTNERAMVFAGDSAGGGLALSTLVALRDDGTRSLGGARCSHRGQTSRPLAPLFARIMNDAHYSSVTCSSPGCISICVTEILEILLRHPCTPICLPCHH